MKNSLFFYSGMLLILIVLSANSCNAPLVDKGLDFTIFNKTPDTITWYIPEYIEQTHLPILPVERPDLRRFIPPNDQYSEFLLSKKESFFEELPSDTLYLFILNYSIYKNENWDDVRMMSDSIQLIKLTEKDLESKNFIVDIS